MQLCVCRCDWGQNWDKSSLKLCRRLSGQNLEDPSSLPPKPKPRWCSLEWTLRPTIRAPQRGGQQIRTAHILICALLYHSCLFPFLLGLFVFFLHDFTISAGKNKPPLEYVHTRMFFTHHQAAPMKINYSTGQSPMTFLLWDSLGQTPLAE